MGAKDSPVAEAATLLQALMAVVNGRGAGKSLLLQHEAGLTFPQIITLYHLNGSDEPQTVSDVARETRLSLGATSQLIDRMLRAGLVTRAEHPDDRRVRLIALTAKGRSLLAKLHGVRNAEWQSVIGRLPRELQERLVDVMTQVMDSLGEGQTPLSARTRPAVAR